VCVLVTVFGYLKGQRSHPLFAKFMAKKSIGTNAFHLKVGGNSGESAKDVLRNSHRLI
jgi:hypothetical protein